LIALRETQAEFNVFFTLSAQYQGMGGGEQAAVKGQGVRRRAAACLAGGALALAVLAGCAQAPAPHQAMTAADLALARAETAGAAHHAPVELARAAAKRQAAQAAVQAKAHERARILAEQAMVDAELAEMRAQAAQAEANAEQ
jgi:hypothetical protein